MMRLGAKPHDLGSCVSRRGLDVVPPAKCLPSPWGYAPSDSEDGEDVHLPETLQASTEAVSLPSEGGSPISIEQALLPPDRNEGTKTKYALIAQRIAIIIHHNL